MRTFLLIYVLVPSILFSQSNGSLLIISDEKAHLMVDGEDKGYIEKGKPLKIELAGGEHYVQLFHVINGAEKAEIVKISEGKQAVHRVSFSSTSNTFVKKVLVVDSHSMIPGLTNDENRRGVVTYHAFEKGDKLHLSFDLQNRNGKCDVTVFAYPNLNVVYSTSGVQQVKEISVDIKERSIYGIQLTTSAVLNRTGHLQVWRTPETETTKDFNTEVRLVETHTAVSVNQEENFFVNGGRNSWLQGGKSRIILPIRLPEGTSKWYYRISSSREESVINQAKNVTSLVGELSTLVDQTGLIAKGIDALTDPPGADYCDVYFLDGANAQTFLNKGEFRHYPQAGRLNFAHGNVEVDFILENEMYLGIKNPDAGHGIHVHVEVVAIVTSNELQMIEN